MRINQFIARALGVSRRQADKIITQSKVTVNGHPAEVGSRIKEDDNVVVDGQSLDIKSKEYLLLNKPPGYVSSRVKQDKNPTVYSLIPNKYHHLKPVGRLDKNSRGLLLLTNDGLLAQKLTHPSFQKSKEYIVELNKPLDKKDIEKVRNGVKLKDGVSKLEITPLKFGYQLQMSEGKNKQIRRTFGALGFEVNELKRTKFANLEINNLPEGKFKILEQSDVIGL